MTLSIPTTGVGSILYRWAYLWDRLFRLHKYWKPDMVSICALFWRTVLLTPLVFVIVSLCISWFIASVMMDPWFFGFILLILIGIAVVFVISIAIISAVVNSEVAGAACKTIFNNAVSAKNKFCPLVSIID